MFVFICAPIAAECKLARKTGSSYFDVFSWMASFEVHCHYRPPGSNDHNMAVRPSNYFFEGPPAICGYKKSVKKHKYNVKRLVVTVAWLFLWTHWNLWCLVGHLEVEYTP